MKEIEINPIIKSAIIAIDDLSTTKNKRVKDHHICYGETYPICEVELNGRGLTNDSDLITCPECAEKIGFYPESII